MKSIFRTILCLSLAAVLLVSLCACGETQQETTKTTTTTTINPADFDPANSYHVYPDGENLYGYAVVDYMGYTLFQREKQISLPEFTPITEDTLMVKGTNTNGTWAVFCNVRASRASSVFGNYLANNETKVAYLEHLTDKYHVFVRDFYDETAYLEVTTLEGLAVSQNGELVKEAKLDKDGNLKVTYGTKDGDKTVTIKMG